MGMDVYGVKPTAKEGEYFRNPAWFWRPLWNYCCIIGKDIIANPQIGWFNDGEGLTAGDALLLAKKLQESIDNGDCDQYAKDYTEALEALPLEECKICDGTGKRKPPPNVGAGDTPCNACKGTGKRKNVMTMYPFDTENVKNFVLFLENCGGFRIC